MGAQSRAASTLRTHGSYWVRFEDWCRQFQLASLPAEEVTVAMFLTHMVNVGNSCAMVASASAAIGCAHSLLGLPSPTSGQLVVNVREAARRAAPVVPRVKDAISPEEVRAVVLAHVVGASDPKQLMRGMTCLLLFAGCLRNDDIRRVRWESIEFSPDGMHLFVPSAKNDQHGRGRSVPVARTHDEFCPVRLTEQFLEAIGHREAGPGPLIRILGRSGRAAAEDRSPCYQTIRQWVLACLESAGVDSSRFGTHSFRKGAATEMANSGVPAEVLQTMGGWACPSVLGRYITHSDSTMFAASRSLSLASPTVSSSELALASGRRQRQRLSLRTANHHLS